MEVLVSGQGFIEAPDDLPLLVVYDPTQPCPPGYVIQWRSGGRDGNYPICRLATREYVNNPSIAEQETGSTFIDYIVIVDDALIATVPQVFSQGIPAVATWLARTAGETVAAVVLPIGQALPLGSIALILGAAAFVIWGLKK